MRRRIAVTGVSLAAVWLTFTHAGAAEWSWQKPNATVLPTGDLEWAPEPFRFDGRRDATGRGVDGTMSLATDADLTVAGTPNGRCLRGEFEFLRIALGTLADARTSIEELHAWQFDGPFLRDWTGRRPRDGKRDAGAIELAER